jgi:hypothetical protein
VRFFFVPALITSTHSSHGGMNGAWEPPDVLTEHKGEHMTEEGTLSIVRHGSPYQVRYASNNPQGRERQPYECPDAETLSALLHQCGAEAGAITQAYAELGQGRMAVLLVALSPEQMQAFFNPTTSRAW